MKRRSFLGWLGALFFVPKPPIDCVNLQHRWGDGRRWGDGGRWGIRG